MESEVSSPDPRQDLPVLRSYSSESLPHILPQIDVSPSSRRRIVGKVKFDPIWFDRLWIFFIIVMWYIISVGAIVTTKLLLTDWNIPPLLLTFQQLVLASSIFRIIISMRPEGIPPLPWENTTLEEREEVSWIDIWENHSDFILAGLFNALDFLASNTAFSHAAASFVETIKSSDAITTTAVALAWNVDQLTGAEAVTIFLLVVGALLSTFANSQSEQGDTSHTPSLQESISGATVVIIANFCFAFRAMFQKRYLASPGDTKLDDINLLCRMQQTGAAALFIPVLMNCSGFIFQALYSLSTEAKLNYVGLSLVNATSYAIYK